MTSRRSQIVLGVVLLGFLAGIVLLVLVHLNLTWDREEIRKREAQLPLTVLRFERAIGYGGFIHNFKNFILRPRETGYRDDAVENHHEALEAIEEIEALSRQLGVPTRMTETRRTLQLYRNQLDWVTRLHAQGAVPKEIDVVVRVSDQPARAEIDELHARLGDIMDLQLGRIDRRIFALLVVFAFFLLGGMAVVFWVLGRDREKLMLRLQLKKDDLEQFTSIAAHDLRAPLRQIPSLIQWVNEDVEEAKLVLPRRAQMNLQRIASRVRQLDVLLNELLNYLHIGGRLVPPEPVDLGALVAEISELFVPAGSLLRCEGEMPEIMVVKVELDIVLRNLISNAVKHGPPKGVEIVLRYRSRRGAHVIEVEDNGPGIPPQHRERVFQMFATLGPRNTEGEVTGVGLAMVMRVVRNRGGSIAIHDARPHGTIFEVVLPRV
ncbi:HAMP domain-containing histidine kinase (plasmid) [Paroceanicella profunda]|uniref:histidine kinase n=1 Tax=Paroceanicella profunda TaxID=2579971 RepID=A0A5B8G041_9RHOB|nr:HAMP domain-containing sensor histidine kinase [Paroceanicella profunda]QDL94075.1 HAMP domain-containing histidine kinase [Paroceanicella profunda]